MPTLKDLAKKASVSVTTASYAVNGSSLITKETREKVLKAAKEIGYRPNGMAKNLKKQKTETIGLFLSGFTGPFFTSMMEGIHEVVMSRGYEMVVCASVDRHRLLIEKNVDGAIILNYHMDDELLTELASEKLPMVVLDRELDHQHICNITLPNQAGTKAVVDYLNSKNHTHLGFMAGSEESYDGEMRLKGFLDRARELDIPFNRDHLIRADFTEKSGYDAMHTYLNKNEIYPTAFLCANDEMAMGAINAIKDHGLKVPEDIAVTGFDNLSISKYFNPPLTTVHVPKKQWGIHAAETLFDMLGKKENIQTSDLGVELIPRDSV
ncbi:LacI family DNA-binding transcriptional regulator [Alteribacter aurantiacus]|uniref:LacI family DNA-binding transcriptional regulator n=1 Tax=Alteribacter aurantiacus TaxID=254410 RepID=UPI0004065E64|nr:LacI family DNA-binding transcriptional regulator [Alteribacter aurantiacus]